MDNENLIKLNKEEMREERFSSRSVVSKKKHKNRKLNYY